jgi:hypothetical protein
MNELVHLPRHLRVLKHLVLPYASPAPVGLSPMKTFIFPCFVYRRHEVFLNWLSSKPLCLNISACMPMWARSYFKAISLDLQVVSPSQGIDIEACPINSIALYYQASVFFPFSIASKMFRTST